MRRVRAVRPTRVQRGPVLTFSRRDGAGVDQFEFRLLGAGQAELRIVLSDEDREELAAEGIQVPKPIVLSKS